MSDGKEVGISEKLFKTGQLCAVYYEWNWHRGIMVDICNDEYVVSIRNLKKNGSNVHFCLLQSFQIYLVDSGIIIDALLHEIQYLRKEFAKLPAQAIRGTLDFIQPEKGVWTHNTNTEFRNLVIQKSFNAKISTHRKKVFDKIKKFSLSKHFI